MIPLLSAGGLGVLGWLGVGALVIAAAAIVFVILSRLFPDKPVRDQRPFHLCPNCSAYNAKAELRCWRCDADLTEGAIEPRGVLGHRLEQMDSQKRTEV